MKKNETFNRDILLAAIKDACWKLSPRKQLENPVMFMVYLSAILTTMFYAGEWLGAADAGVVPADRTVVLAGAAVDPRGAHRRVAAASP